MALRPAHLLDRTFRRRASPTPRGCRASVLLQGRDLWRLQILCTREQFRDGVLLHIDRVSSLTVSRLVQHSLESNRVSPHLSPFHGQRRQGARLRLYTDAEGTAGEHDVVYQAEGRTGR
jgi:hypothetical protein